MTLPEVCEIALGDTPTWLKYSIAQKISNKWRYLRTSYLMQHSSNTELMVKESCDAFGVLQKRIALPYKIAFDSVSSWIPGALTEIKKDVDTLISFIGGITPKQIEIGENAKEELV